MSGFLSITTAALAWGLSGTVAKILFHEAVQPIVLTGLRSFIAALALGGVMLLRGQSFRVPPRQIGFVLWLGVLFFGVSYVYYVAISVTNVAIAVMLQYTAPLFVALYAVASRSYVMTRTLWGLLILSLCGCFFLVGGYNLELVQLNLLGIGAGLLSAIIFATYNLAVNRGHARGLDVWTMAFYAFAIATLLSLSVMPGAEWPVDASIRQWSFLIYVGIFGTFVPFMLHIIGLRYLHAFPATIIGMIEPVTAAVTAYVLLGESLEVLQIVGMSGICVAIAMLRKTSMLQKGQITDAQAI